MISETKLQNRKSIVTFTFHKESEAKQIAIALLFTGLILTLITFIIFNYDAINSLRNSAEAFFAVTSVQAFVMLLNEISDIIVSTVLELLSARF